MPELEHVNTMMPFSSRALQFAGSVGVPGGGVGVLGGTDVPPVIITIIIITYTQIAKILHFYGVMVLHTA